jgi:hypothetical protein
MTSEGGFSSLYKVSLSLYVTSFLELLHSLLIHALSSLFHLSLTSPLFLSSPSSKNSHRSLSPSFPPFSLSISNRPPTTNNDGRNRRLRPHKTLPKRPRPHHKPPPDAFHSRHPHQHQYPPNPNSHHQPPRQTNRPRPRSRRQPPLPHLQRRCQFRRIHDRKPGGRDTGAGGAGREQQVEARYVPGG